MEKVTISESFIIEDGKCTYTDKHGNQITGVEAYRKYYFRTDKQTAFPLECPDLLAEYFNRILQLRLTDRRSKVGSHFNDQRETERFISEQIEFANKIIANRTEQTENEKTLVSKIMFGKILEKERAVLEVYVDLLKTYINDSKPESDTRTKNDLSNLTLKQKVKSTDYNTLLRILSEKGFINPETLIWIDKGKGHKGMVAALLKRLFDLGYYGKNDLGNEEVKAIAKNTFGIDVKIDTVKKAKNTDFTVYFNDIPTVPSSI